jgi:hypothetical protein
MFCASMHAYCELGINIFGDDQADTSATLGNSPDRFTQLRTQMLLAAQ